MTTAVTAAISIILLSSLLINWYLFRVITFLSRRCEQLTSERKSLREYIGGP